MPGKRIRDERAHEGPEENRAHGAGANRGARKGGRLRLPQSRTGDGLSEKDQQRAEAFARESETKPG